MNDRDDYIIRASEVGQYLYCPHAWWLGCIEGRPSAHWREMAAGKAAHARHGRRVRSALWANRLAYLLLTLAVLVGVLWVSGW